MITRTNDASGDEDQESVERSGFSDEFSTQTANDQKVDHFDTDHEGSEGGSSPSHRLEVPTPTPLSGTGTPTKKRADKAKCEVIDVETKPTGTNTGKKTTETRPQPKRSRIEASSPNPDTAKWKIGGPYYRGDGPGNSQRSQPALEDTEVAEVIFVEHQECRPGEGQNNGPTIAHMYAFANTQAGSSGIPVSGYNVANMVQATREMHPTTVMDGAGNIQPTFSLEQTAQMFPPWRTTYVSPQNSPNGRPSQGNMTPWLMLLLLLHGLRTRHK